MAALIAKIPVVLPQSGRMHIVRHAVPDMIPGAFLFCNGSIKLQKRPRQLGKVQDYLHDRRRDVVVRSFLPPTCLRGDKL